MLLLSHGTGVPLLEIYLFHLFPFEENSVKPIAFLANLKIIVSVSAIEKKNPSNYARSQVRFENYSVFRSYSRYQNSPIRVSFLLPDNNDKFHFVATIFLQLGFIVIQFFYSKYKKDYNVSKKYIYF